MAREHFAPFRPGFLLVQSADPVEKWTGCGTEMRQVVGLLGALRQRETSPELSSAPCHDTDFYERYSRIHDRQVAEDPQHARHARREAEDDLRALAVRGLVFDVLVDGAWVGVVAAEPDDRHGVHGATVIELLLDQPYRGRGYGKELSVLLARGLSLPDHACLMGTIHADNTTAYHSALSAGRVDVGGEIRIPV